MNLHFKRNRSAGTAAKKRSKCSVLAGRPLLLAILLLAAVSCNDKSDDEKFSKYKMGVTMYGGSGLSEGYSSVFCDSVNMISTKEVDVFIDGSKLRLKADKYITVWSNSR